MRDPWDLPSELVEAAYKLLCEHPVYTEGVGYCCPACALVVHHMRRLDHAEKCEGLQAMVATNTDTGIAP